MVANAAYGALGGWCQARARQQPATEAAIVVTVGRPCGAVLRACRCCQAADLARRRGKRTVMVVRLVARHRGDQAFAIVGHAALHGLGKRRNSGHMRRLRILVYEDVQEYIPLQDRARVEQLVERELPQAARRRDPRHG